MTVSYHDARSAYLDSYAQLFEPTFQESMTMRSSGDGLDQDVLAQRATNLAEKSDQLTEATASYLTEPEMFKRMNAANSLLEQATADLSVARMLWETIEASGSGDPGVVQRSAGGVTMRRAADSLRETLPESIDETADGQFRRAYESFAPPTTAAALDTLRTDVKTTLDLIESKVVEISLQSAGDLLRVAFTQWNVIVTGARIVGTSAGAGDIIAEVEKKIDSAFNRLARALGSIIGSVVNKIMALISTNRQAQDTILGYLDQARDKAEEDGIELFERLVRRFLGVSNFLTVELDIWLEDAQNQDVEKIDAASKAVKTLKDNFETLTRQADRFLELITGGSILATSPPLMSIAFGLQVGLLSTVVFAAYDYIDVGGRGLNITRGVKEVLITNLNISETTRQRAQQALEDKNLTRPAASDEPLIPGDSVGDAQTSSIPTTPTEQPLPPSSFPADDGGSDIPTLG